ncbi:hypothetical protein [Streptomyces sp. 5-10]|uniref:hypothetical protein n=1 Tax=Streptomyces sp. 5-10 TaxID=878925 RepID=UPI00168B3FB9|nr:hypothetical protein [Streptomyces sp. 5-10]MBD3004564.1 hypothetical protein [Streptomyces sp. 5-10]
MGDDGPRSLAATYRLMVFMFLLGAAAALLAVAAHDSGAPGPVKESDPGRVTVDTGKLPGPHCWYEVGRDESGRVSREPICP